MRLWEKLRERRAAKQEEREREADEDLEALARGDIEDLATHKRKIRDEDAGEGFPSAGTGYLPPPRH
jgi:hypothetical protein